MWLNRKLNKESCASQVNKQHKIEVEQNRKNFVHIIECIAFCAKQGIALRGSDETSSSQNQGNFLELLHFLAKYVPELGSHLDNKVAKYTGPKSQNEILSCLASYIKKQLLPTDIYAVVVDETMDLSKDEMLAFCVRFCDDQLQIHENFLGFFNIQKQDAETISSLIKQVIFSLGLDLMKLVAQAYDGCATMAGHKNGVAARIRQNVEWAIFIHCYAHQLNLAVEASTISSKNARLAIFIVGKISVFVNQSAKRHALFEKMQNNDSVENESDQYVSLKKLCPTRWSSRFESFEALLKNFKIAKNFLEVSLN